MVGTPQVIEKLQRFERVIDLLKRKLKRSRSIKISHQRRVDVVGQMPQHLWLTRDEHIRTRAHHNRRKVVTRAITPHRAPIDIGAPRWPRKPQIARPRKKADAVPRRDKPASERRRAQHHAGYGSITHR